MLDANSPRVATAHSRACAAPFLSLWRAGFVANTLTAYTHVCHCSDENDYLYAKLIKKPDFKFNTHDAWIGATDMKNEGSFSWIGPKRLMNGVKFWEGDMNGQAIDGRYTNWGQDSSGNQNQPDSNGEEDCIEMKGYSPGRWNDKNCYQPNEFFIVEFGTPATTTDH